MFLSDLLAPVGVYEDRVVIVVASYFVVDELCGCFVRLTTEREASSCIQHLHGVQFSQYQVQNVEFELLSDQIFHLLTFCEI